MKLSSISGALLVAIALVAGAGAHSPNANGNCANVGDDTYSVVGIALAVGVPGVGTVYVGDDLTLWTESNGVPGLQTHAHTCRLNGVITHVPADTPLGA